MEDFNEIRDMLTPRRDIKASDVLRRRIDGAIADTHRKEVRRRRSRRLWGALGLGAAAAIAVIVLTMPIGMSAREILAGVLDSFLSADHIGMVVEVRTLPAENFRYIDRKEPFVRHSVSISRSDSVTAWRIDKGVRAAVGRNGEVSTWVAPLKLGWHMHDADLTDFLGYFATLLNPSAIIETELEQSLTDDSAAYSISRKDGEILLTVHAMPHGDFTNPYLLNTSIAESENVRRYVIDAASRRLKAASVSVVSGHKETVVLRISSITYAPDSPASYALPADVTFIETDRGPAGLNGLSAEEAASTVLNAFADWDREILDRVMFPGMSDAAYRERFIGSRLLSVGTSFTSGSGNTIFVPYRLRLSDGTIQRHNIALQRSSAGGWIVVGGL